MKISSFTKSYDGVTVLDFPGLELQPGTVYSVIGANGSGKSTFAKILAGVIKPNGKAGIVNDISIGYMPQKNFAFRMSTKANILLGGSDTQRAQRLMEAMQITHLADKRADHLSGGETARMALVRLMMKSFDLVILDEPTAAMDMETTALAEEQILQYVKETNCAMILVTHSLQQARRVSDQVLFFRKGQLMESGCKDVVLYNPAREETRAFLDFYGT